MIHERKTQEYGIIKVQFPSALARDLEAMANVNEIAIPRDDVFLAVRLIQAENLHVAQCITPYMPDMEVKFVRIRTELTQEIATSITEAVYNRLTNPRLENHNVGGEDLPALIARFDQCVTETRPHMKSVDNRAAALGTAVASDFAAFASRCACFKDSRKAVEKLAAMTKSLTDFTRANTEEVISNDAYRSAVLRMVYPERLWRGMALAQPMHEYEEWWPTASPTVQARIRAAIERRVGEIYRTY